MSVSFEEIGYLAVTLPEGTCQEDQVCKVGADGTAQTCAAGDRFCGVVKGLRGGFAGVQIHGIATVPYTGTAPTCGYGSLCADGIGGVKTASAGTTYLVLQVDTTAKTVTFQL